MKDLEGDTGKKMKGRVWGEKSHGRTLHRWSKANEKRGY